jgi:xylan 1,4-beta-xylosidase
MRNATVTIDLARPAGPMEIGKMALGQGGLSSDPIWESRIAEIRALKPRIIRFWAQEYFHPMPEPGRISFAAVDRAIDPVLKAGATPLVSLNFKPRPLFPEINEKNLTPSDWKQWEDLIYQFVKHYADQGHTGWYWEVIGETDCGEGGGCPYLGTPESYPPFYDHTAAAVLRADPMARVGGPALGFSRNPILPALLKHCDSGRVPLHFISWHIYTNDPKNVRETIDYVKGLLRNHPALKVETILDEWSVPSGANTRATDPRFLCSFIPETIWQMKDAGLDYSCYYQIRDYHVDMNEFEQFFTHEGAAFMTRWWNRMPQLGGLFDFQNNMRPAYFSFKLLSRLTGNRIPAESTDDKVHALATRDPDFRMSNLLFWNFSATPVKVKLVLQDVPAGSKGVPFVLDPLTPSNDENQRIRMSEEFDLTPGTCTREIELAPWDVRLWYVHGKSWDLGN